jgi:hypothetical protein
MRSKLKKSSLSKQVFITANLEVIAIVTKTKYQSFDRVDISAIEKISTDANIFNIKDIQIRSPNNPAELIDAKLIGCQK